MRPLQHLAICALVLTGCSSSEPVHPTGGTGEAVAELNRQIEKFNAERPGDMGITPIAQRVARVGYAADRDAVSAFDRSGALLLVLTRQPDDRFKGVLEVDYHQLPKPEGHSWGHVLAEFTLRPEMFRPGGGAKGSQPIPSDTNRGSSAAGSGG